MKTHNSRLTTHDSRPKVLLIGGNGFIGCHLADKLYEIGYHVAIADLFNKAESSYDFIPVDITDPIIIKEEFDYVIHLAGLSYDIDERPLMYERINTIGTINILEWLKERQIKKFIFISSGSIYGGEYNHPVSEDDLPNPQSPYAISKFNAEKWVEYYSEKHKIDTIIFRLFNVYGRGMSEQTCFGEIKRQIYSSSQNIIMRNIHDVIDAVHIHDVIEALIKGLEYYTNVFEVFNVSNNKELSIQKIIKLSMEITRIKKELKSLKQKADSNRVGNNNQIKTQLNWKPKMDINTGLKDFFTAEEE
ncbi:MAG: NAD-dependent epimerase/dehydratase family protein [Saprospiraceae bacterium]|nr:NAD-dependent epimerase/dehydratase family protein [Saprospiraceae bacterium]